MGLESSLANIIVKHLQAEFSIRHLSGNLVNTIKITQTKNGYAIEIPAEVYNILLYKKKGVIIYTNNGSYASKIDHTGGFSGAHVGYVNRVINNAIQEWLAVNEIKGKIR